jgi:hypothetical protein
MTDASYNPGSIQPPDEQEPRWMALTTPLLWLGTALAAAFTIAVVVSDEPKSRAATAVKLELPKSQPWVGPGFNMPVL